MLAAPAVILLLVFTVYPVCYLFYRSMLGGNLISRTRSLWAGQLQALLDSSDFHEVLRNTAIYTLITVVLTIVLAVIIAAWLARRSPAEPVGADLPLHPHIISVVSVSTLFLWLMDSKNGFFNAILNPWAWSPSRFWPLRTPPCSPRPGDGLEGAWVLCAAHHGGPAEHPHQRIEAAEMDDTPRLRTFFKITLPMISPTILFTTVVATIASFKVFDSISIMTGGGPLNSTNTLVYYIYDYAYRYGKPGQACAAGVILLIFVCVVTYLQFRVSKKNVHYQ